MNSRLLFHPFATILFVTAAPGRTGRRRPDRRVLTLTGNETVRAPATRARLTNIVEHGAKNPRLRATEITGYPAQCHATLADRRGESGPDHERCTQPAWRA